MHENGMKFREIEKIKGVHHTTVINWVKQVKSNNNLDLSTTEERVDKRAESLDSKASFSPESPTSK